MSKQYELTREEGSSVQLSVSGDIHAIRHELLEHSNVWYRIGRSDSVVFNLRGSDGVLCATGLDEIASFVTCVSMMVS